MVGGDEKMKEEGDQKQVKDQESQVGKISQGDKDNFMKEQNDDGNATEDNLKTEGNASV